MTLRTEELANFLVAGLSEGTPLRQLCRDKEIGKSSVYVWMKEDEAFAGRIARAREEGFDNIAEETLEIADTTEKDQAAVAQSKLRIETRLKLLAKWDPKRYGDKITQEHTGADGGPIRTVLATDKLSDAALMEIAGLEAEK